MAFWIPAIIVVNVLLRARQVATIAGLAAGIIGRTRPQNFQIAFRTVEASAREVIMRGQVVLERGTLVLSRFDVRIAGAASNSRDAANTLGPGVMRQISPHLADLARRSGARQIIIRAERVAGARVNSGTGAADIQRAFDVVGNRLVPVR